MNKPWCLFAWASCGMLVTSVAALERVHAQEPSKVVSSYMPVDIKDSFAAIRSRMEAAKPPIMQRPAERLLKERRSSAIVRPGAMSMPRGKPPRKMLFGPCSRRG